MRKRSRGFLSADLLERITRTHFHARQRGGSPNNRAQCVPLKARMASRVSVGERRHGENRSSLSAAANSAKLITPPAPPTLSCSAGVPPLATRLGRKTDDRLNASGPPAHTPGVAQKEAVSWNGAAQRRLSRQITEKQQEAGNRKKHPADGRRLI